MKKINDQDCYKEDINFPCFKMFKESIVNSDDEDLVTRSIMGTIGLFGTVVYDPVDWMLKKLDIDRGEPSDPDDPWDPIYH